jgi:hypothetical protein
VDRETYGAQVTEAMRMPARGDPDNILNPGNVCAPMDLHLRYGEGYRVKWMPALLHHQRGLAANRAMHGQGVQESQGDVRPFKQREAEFDEGRANLLGE